MLTLVEDVFHLSSQEAYQYNRENFLYDRALRRRKEFQVRVCRDLNHQEFKGT